MNIRWRPHCVSLVSDLYSVYIRYTSCNNVRFPVYIIIISYTRVYLYVGTTRNNNNNNIIAYIHRTALQRRRRLCTSGTVAFYCRRKLNLYI